MTSVVRRLDTLRREYDNIYGMVQYILVSNCSLSVIWIGVWRIEEA